jgi:hypothetical protein
MIDITRKHRKIKRRVTIKSVVSSKQTNKRTVVFSVAKASLPFVATLNGHHRSLVSFYYLLRYMILTPLFGLCRFLQHFNAFITFSLTCFHFDRLAHLFCRHIIPIINQLIQSYIKTHNGPRRHGKQCIISRSSINHTGWCTTINLGL